MKFSIAITVFLLAIVSMVSASSIAQVKQDIQAIDASVESLDKHTHVDTLNYFNGLAIRQASQELTSKLKAGSESVKALKGAPSEEEAKEILELLSGTETKVKRVTAQMVKFKPQFEKLGVLRVATESVNEFKDEVKAFSAEILKFAPASKKSAGKVLAKKFNDDLARCAAAYNSGSTNSAGSGASGVASSDAGGKSSTGKGKESA